MAGVNGLFYSKRKVFYPVDTGAEALRKKPLALQRSLDRVFNCECAPPNVMYETDQGDAQRENNY